MYLNIDNIYLNIVYIIYETKNIVDKANKLIRLIAGNKQLVNSKNLMEATRHIGSSIDENMRGRIMYY